MPSELTLVLMAAVLSGPAFSQTETEAQDQADEHIVVTATRNPLPGRELGASVIVIPREDIEASGAQTVSQVLEGLPGINLRRSGGAGSNAEILMRGDKGGHTLVMIDGVEFADVSSIEKNFDIGDMPLHEVERIEIVKGPHSVAYGASGLSGVIHIITRRPQVGTTVHAGFEVGTYESLGAHAGVSGKEGAFGYALNLSGNTTAGYSHTASRDDGEADAFTRKDGSLRLQYGQGEAYNADLFIKATHALADIDGGAGIDDPNAQVKREDASAQLTQKIRYGQIFETRIVASLSQSDRHFTNDLDTLTPGNESTWERSRFQGERRSLELSELVKITSDQTLMASAQWVRDSAAIKSQGASSYGAYDDELPEEKIEDRSFALQYQWGLLDRVYGQWGVRTLDSSNFGEKTVGQAAFHVLVIPEWTSLRLNYGRGFKTPSLYQLRAPVYGSSDLQPETVVSIEGSLEQRIIEGLSASVTGFQNQTENLIEFNGATSQYYNINRGLIKGLEATLHWDMSEQLATEAQYTHLSTLDQESNRPLPSRPDDSYSGSILWKREALTWKTSIRGQNRSRPSYVEATEGFHVVDTNIALRQGPTRVSLKVSNLFNSWYQEVAGYNTPGRNYLMSADYTY